MACCALGLFVLFWLIAPLRRLGAMLGMSARRDRAVDWRPDMPAPAPMPRRRAPRMAALALGLGLVAVPVWASSTTTPARNVADMIRASLCTGWTEQR